MEVLPSEVYQNIDAIAHGQDGTLAVASSSMTGRIWNGSLWTFKDASTAPDPEYSSGRACTEAGINDVQWLDSSRMVVGLDDGSVEIWAQTGSLPGLENLASLTEHDDIVSSVSVDCARKRIISGSRDRSIKLWDLNSEQCMITYKGGLGLNYLINH
ncbi:methylosome protein 50-like [Actinia tenebrosa]|uniref:Methylosome protein 50-like n=1 Tax=Actinia tenebrosa TaxID=6105 RepID=A0A6P8J0F3_ACTTE|nr:methylosome protein 50-like [Actinia tenebrosa]